MCKQYSLPKWATKKNTSYFPSNPGWLIGIIDHHNRLFNNPYIIGIVLIIPYYNLNENQGSLFFHTFFFHHPAPWAFKAKRGDLLGRFCVPRASQEYHQPGDVCFTRSRWYDRDTPLSSLTWLDGKSPIFNRKYIFKWSIFQCHVSFQGCMILFLNSKWFTTHVIYGLYKLKLLKWGSHH